jgi:uncharacterized membrane protein YphA (DoxX/SURF4 family)
MMQSSPLNFRRAVMWLGRLILGPVFLYAGYSKVFLPNSHFWPWFLFKFSLSTNIANFAFQVDAFKLLSPAGVQFVAHTLPFTEMVLGFLVLIGWQLRIFGTMLAAIMVGFSVVVARAYLLHMNINCGCFATPQPIDMQKVLEDAGMALLAVLMAAFAIIEARNPHPWTAPDESPAAVPATK